MVLFYIQALNAIMADSIPVGARGRIYAVTVSIPNAVRVIAPYLGGYLIVVYTLQPALRLSYTLSFCIGVVVVFIRLRYLKETITNGERIGRKVPKILLEGYKNVFTSLKWVISNMPGYIGMAVLLSFIGSLVMPFWIVYAQSIIGISAYMWGVILLIGGLVNTLSSLVVGNLIDRIGIRKCMITAFLLSIPPMFLFTLARDIYQVAAIWIVLMIASSFLWISSSVYLADSIPRSMRGRVMAGVGQGVSFGVTGVGYSSGFLLFIPMTIGSVISGYIYNYNSVYPWYIQSVFLTVGLIICLFFIKNPEKPEA
jgi:MFS family permease